MNLAGSIPRLRAEFAAAQAYLGRWPWRDESAIAPMQLAKAAAAWSDAVADVPYYRDLVAAGRAPRAIACWDDFRAIPVLERATLQQEAARFARLSGPPDERLQTAGSTGNPIRFGAWSDEARAQRIAKLASWIRCGYRLGSELVLLWGHSHLLGTGARRWVNHAKRRVKDALAGYHRVDAYSLDDADCRAVAALVARVRPVGVIGYAAALDRVARRARESRDRVRAAGVRFVLTSAEPPPRADTREVLRDFFGDSTLVDEFGGVEFGQVGVRFDDDPWQVFPDLAILEAERARAQSEGEPLLVTTLARRYTPLFRYRQGDLVREPRRLATGQVVGFAALAGRSADMVEMPDGAAVHSVAFFHCAHQEPAVLAIQMALEDAGPRVRLVVADADAGLEARIRARLARVHPALATAPLDRVADVATNAAGKRRWFVDRRTKTGGP